MEAEVLLITDKDFRDFSVFNILQFFISGLPPLHRYQASLVLAADRLLIGDIKSNYEQFITIAKREVLQIYMGFDETYRFYYTRGLGLRWQPVRLQVENHEFIFLYLIFRDKFWGDSNKIWFENLKLWLI